MPTFNQRDLRNCLGSFVTGVTVVTTLDSAGRPVGVTANSFSSVSLEPPLVLWSQALSAKSYPAFRDAKRFVINILSEEQTELSARFAKAGEDKFANTAIRAGIDGLPILQGCVAFLECVKVATYPGGDHAVQLGQVENFEWAQVSPLAFHAGKYMLTRTHDLGVFSLENAAARFTHVTAVKTAVRALPDISKHLDATVGIAVWGNRGATVIAWEPSRNPVTYDLQTGLVVSPLFSASGLVFSAFLSPDRTDPIIARELAELGLKSAALVPTIEEIKMRTDRVRRLGISHAVPDRLGLEPLGGVITAFGVPIFDLSRNLLFCLTGVGRTDQVGSDETGSFSAALKREAESLTCALGDAERRFYDASQKKDEAVS